MFTGIINETGTITRFRRDQAAGRITVRRSGKSRLARGESIAVDGVCLTIAAMRNGAFEADLSPETLARTALGRLERGAKVNLERPLRLTDRLGGHLVQGHVDAVGRVQTIERNGAFVMVRWTFPREFEDLVVQKGSIAVNGISLTIVDPDHNSFAAAVIPETLRKTNLGALAPGDAVNLEFDLIAKMVLRLIQPYTKASRRR